MEVVSDESAVRGLLCEYEKTRLLLDSGKCRIFEVRQQLTGMNLTLVLGVTGGWTRGGTVSLQGVLARFPFLPFTLASAIDRRCLMLATV